MQIREKGRQVLCIKTTYSKKDKRTFGSVIAKQEIGLSTASEEVCQLLSKEEVDELNLWLSKRDEKRSVEDLEGSLSILSIVLTKSARALDDSAQLDDQEVSAIIDGLDRLKKSLRKRGIKLTRQTEKKSAVKKGDDSQLKLDD